MAFQGWTGDFVGFFRGLEHDNSKRYFEANRKRYEADVRGPMLALMAELEPEVGPGKMFRINRDVRFSADKSPYKTNVGAVVGPLYVHLDARRFFVATGEHMPDNAWLARYRAAVAGPAGAEFSRIVERARRDGFNLEGNPLKTAPKGYDRDHERIELLRWRSVTIGRGWDLEPWIATPEVKSRVLEAWRGMQPFSNWLRVHVPAGSGGR